MEFHLLSVCPKVLEVAEIYNNNYFLCLYQKRINKFKNNPDL